jgi:hypothetical protein
MLMTNELSPFFHLSLIDFPKIPCSGQYRIFNLYYWGMSNLKGLDIQYIYK